MKTKVSILCAILLVTTSVTGVSQTQQSTDIMERISVYMPIFQEPDCSTFLNQFGDTEKSVYKNAETIGLTHFSTGKPPDAEGTYFHVFLDPENIINGDGIELTEHVVYTFVFNSNKKYFSFAATLAFKSPLIAREVHAAMLEKAGALKYKKEFSDVIQCRKNSENSKDAKSRMVTIKLDGNTITFVVIDYDSLLEMAKKAGSRG